MTPVLADTGFLVALFDPQDKHANAAATYLRDHAHPLATTLAAVVKACFFLEADQKIALLTWCRRGAIRVHDVPVAAFAQFEVTLRKYKDQEIDFADAALVWLSGEVGSRRILTADEAHFTLLRVKGGRFELVEWY